MDSLMIVYIIVAAVIGALIGRLSVRNLLRGARAEATALQSQLSESDRSLASERERRTLQEEQLAMVRRELAKLRDESDLLRNRLESEIDHRAKAESEARRVPTLEKLLEGADEARNGLLDELRQHEVELAEIKSTLENDRRTASEKIQLLEDAKRQLTIVFENTASKMLEDKAERFTKLNDSNMERLLKPFGDEMQNFKKKVEEVYDRESKERFSLGKEVERLINATSRISEDATNLTKALTSNSKVQGDWGEEILERILETCGLTKGREFFVQEHLRDTDGTPLVNQDGSRMRPDVILKYPDERQVIIDSKVSLTDYNRHVSAISEDNGKAALVSHVASMKNHILDLSRKHYQDHAPALDFVMLFVPVEAAYMVAMQSDPNLWHFAFSRRVLLTSPTNLVVAMKLISDLWKRDAQAKNYEEIVDRGGRLYDKFALVVESLNELGQNLGRTERSYIDAVNRIADGPGNLMTQVEKLKKLGATAKKSLPSVDQVAASTDGLSLTGMRPAIAATSLGTTELAIESEPLPAKTRAKQTLFE
jgi:DNA recombination protein RmuC